MIEVNLIPDVKKELIRAQIQRNMVVSIAIIASIGAGIAIALIASYVYVAQGLMMSNTDKAITTEFDKLSQVEDLDKMLTIRNQLGTVSTLNKDKLVTSRLYTMLDVIVPHAPHSITLSSITVEPQVSDGTEAAEGSGEEGVASGAATVVTLEGQTAGSFATLEVFEKQIAAAVIEYKPNDGFESSGNLECGTEGLQCQYLTVGGGDRSTAVTVTDRNFGQDQKNERTLYFKLSFVIIPEVFSNNISNVTMKIGQDGKVTDSYRGVPRAIFGTESKKEDGDGN